MENHVLCRHMASVDDTELIRYITQNIYREKYMPVAPFANMD